MLQWVVGNRPAALAGVSGVAIGSFSKVLSPQPAEADPLGNLVPGYSPADPPQVLFAALFAAHSGHLVPHLNWPARKNSASWI
jgi:hypothetical protein